VFVTDYEGRDDRYSVMEENYSGYEMYDQGGERIGKVDDIFLDENDQPEYFGVKMGFMGTNSTLIPADVTQADASQRRIEVTQPMSTIKDGPTFGSDSDITPEFEGRVRSYYGLDSSGYSEGRGSFGAYGADYDTTSTSSVGNTPGTDEGAGEVGPGVRVGDTESGAFRGHAESDEGVRQTSGSDLADEDEVRVQRSEEELVAGTREREAGRVGIRKRVRTDRERIAVPKRREQVSVERVPVEGRTASEAEIGEDEVVMPVTEEEVVVSKRPVVKEEVRVSTDVVEEEEIVEEDVRREEIEVIDETTTGGTTTTGGLDDDETTGRRGL
jgi:uncharacterized protein (TIGR02271 family)